jgi:hypothetical protein
VNKTLPLPEGAPAGTVANLTLYCKCDEGYEGANCASAITPLVITAVALTAGAIAGIVIGVAVFLCVTGGAAYGASTFLGTGSVGPVVNNPLYTGEGNKGTNPLYKV